MHIFISHATDDDAFVSLLASQLSNKGFTVWADSDLDAGMPWADSIEKAIQESSSVVVVLTPESCNSAYVTFEWAYAWGCGKPLIPLLVRECELHPRLKLIQYLDFRKPDSTAWAYLFRYLRNPKSASGFEISRKKTLPQEIEILVKELTSSSSTERIEAINSLVLHNHPASHEAVIDALASPFFDVRFKAALSRSRKGDERALKTLLEGMRSDDRGIRDEARTAFLKLSVALAGPTIGDVLKSNQAQTAVKSVLSKFRRNGQKRVGNDKGINED
jgi:hypothetical protein